MKTHRMLVGLAALTTIASATAADLYKWTDEKGQVHYTSSLPPEAARKPQQIDTANPGNVTALPMQAAAEGAANAPGVLFILDASGSMKARIDNREKMVIAKEVMTNLLRDLPDTIKVGLEVYGHHSKGDCNDIEVMAPIGQADKATLIQRIQAIDPKGMTPITQSLQVAAEQLKTVEQETTVVLVSDGEETCKGDPCAVVGSLLQQGIKLKIHVIGFDVGDKEKQQLMCIAKAGNGKYFAANNAEQLKSALTEVKQEVVKKIEAPPPPPVVAQVPPPPPVPEKKVVKMLKMPALGTIKITTKHTGIIYIRDQTGKIVATFSGDEMVVPAGTYKLEISGVPVEIQVEGGKIIDVSPLLGTIRITTKHTGIISISDQTGKIVTTFSGDEMVVPAGTYKLEISGVPVEIQVEGGKTIDVSPLLGTIRITTKHTGIISISDQTGKIVAIFSGDEMVVPAGTYKLEISGVPVEIQVEGGQEVVLEQ